MTRSTSSSPISRRTALAGLGAGGLGLAALTVSSPTFAQDASPEATVYPLTDHPVIGSWQWTNLPNTPMESISFAIFTATSVYVETGDVDPNHGFVALGAWRPTGERTAELVQTGQTISLDAVFASGSFTQECLLARGTMNLRVMIEIDGTGNRLTGEGSVEEPDTNGGVTVLESFRGRGDRLTIAVDTFATPAS